MVNPIQQKSRDNQKITKQNISNLKPPGSNAKEYKSGPLGFRFREQSWTVEIKKDKNTNELIIHTPSSDHKIPEKIITTEQLRVHVENLFRNYAIGSVYPANEDFRKSAPGRPSNGLEMVEDGIRKNLDFLGVQPKTYKNKPKTGQEELLNLRRYVMEKPFTGQPINGYETIDAALNAYGPYLDNLSKLTQVWAAGAALVQLPNGRFRWGQTVIDQESGSSIIKESIGKLPSGAKVISSMRLSYMSQGQHPGRAYISEKYILENVPKMPSDKGGNSVVYIKDGRSGTVARIVMTPKARNIINASLKENINYSPEAYPNTSAYSTNTTTEKSYPSIDPKDLIGEILWNGLDISQKILPYQDAKKITRLGVIREYHSYATTDMN